MDFLFSFLGFLAIILLVAFLITRLATSAQGDKPFDIHTISPDDDWVGKAFDYASKKITESQYNRIGKPVRTQQGEYRAAFLKDAEKIYDELYIVCCDENGFSEDFAQYCIASHPDPVRRELRDILIEY